MIGGEAPGFCRQPTGQLLEELRVKERAVYAKWLPPALGALHPFSLCVIIESIRVLGLQQCRRRSQEIPLQIVSSSRTVSHA